MPMNVQELRESVARDVQPPATLTLTGRALWLMGKGRWEEAHVIAQDMESAEGSWLHALVHLYEGDVSNAHYWFHRAGRPAVGTKKVPELWEQIATEVVLSR
jgi:hypothetical protein